MPPVNKGDIPGVRDITIDGQDNIWFSMRRPGSKSELHKFEPATEKLTYVEGTAGQFVADAKLLLARRQFVDVEQRDRFAALREHEHALDSGALVTIDPRRMRVTLLPLKKSENGGKQNP